MIFAWFIRATLTFGIFVVATLFSILMMLMGGTVGVIVDYILGEDTKL